MVEKGMDSVENPAWVWKRSARGAAWVWKRSARGVPSGGDNSPRIQGADTS